MSKCLTDHVHTQALYSIIKWFFRLVHLLPQQPLWRHKEPFQNSSDVQSALQSLNFHTCSTGAAAGVNTLLKGTVAETAQGKNEIAEKCRLFHPGQLSNLQAPWACTHFFIISKGI